MRHFIESHFGFILLLSVAVGFVAPISGVPNDSASVALAMLTYASCFKLRDGGFADIRWRAVAWFYVARYIILPVLLFGITHIVIPQYALGVFLLALVPAAVSSPAFAHMFGGSVPPAFAITIMSTLLAPFLIPLQFMWASEVALNVSPLSLFRTLAFCIFLPMLLYFATRKLPRWSGVMYDNVKIISITLVAFVIALVIAKQRDIILADIPALMLPLAASISCFIIFIAAGAWLGRKQPREIQTTYMVCSGFNNVALGVSLALLHFPPNIILLVAVSEAAWAMLPMMIRLGRHGKNTSSD